MAQRIKKGDSVLVLSGKDRGKRGTVERVFPREGKVLVGGVNVITRHVKQRQGVAQAGRIQQESPVDLSRVMLVNQETGKPGRVGWQVLQDGTKVRTVKSGKRS
jgi:large subunit ribosomal protein L24